MSRPWFPLYAADLLVDERVAQLTDRQFRLLVQCWCHACLNDGIPSYPKALGKLLGITTPAAENLMRFLSDFFEISNRFPGRLVSPRMEQSAIAYEHKVNKLKENGAKGGRGKKAIALVPEKQKHQEPQPQPEKDKEGTKVPSCSVPAKADPKPTSPVLYEVPCSGAGPKSWPLTQAKLDEWAAAFPGVEVKSELRKACQWLRDNPAKTKTHRGMPAFFGRWLGNAQDRNPHPPITGAQNGHPQTPHRHSSRDASLLAQVGAAAQPALPILRGPDLPTSDGW